MTAAGADMDWEILLLRPDRRLMLLDIIARIWLLLPIFADGACDVESLGCDASGGFQVTSKN